MKTRIAGLLIALLLCWGCEFASGPGGGGTGGEGLTGILVDAGGSPVAGAKVRVYPEEYILAKGSLDAASPRRDSTVTDAAGRFRFTNLAKGRYNLEASALRGDSVWSVFIPGIYVDGPVDLGTNTVQTSGSLSITVKNESYAPLSGAQCHIVGGPWEAASNDSGVCLLTGLAPGRYKVLVTYPGLQSVVVENVTVMAGYQVNGGSLRLTPSESGTDTAWTVRYNLDGESFAKVAWSGSLLVAVGNGTDVYGDPYGLILTSPDGITWTKRNSATTRGLADVVWAGNQFVAIGDKGKVLASPDGIAWAPRALLDTTWPFTSITWSGTKLLATGWTYSATSSDGGVSWNKISQQKDMSDVAWSGSQFVAVGSGIAWTSPDGVTWTVRDPQTTNSLEEVAWGTPAGSGSGQFVAVGASGTIRTSADGITWEKRVSGTTDYFTSVVWVNGRWIVNGSLQSTDGILWTPIPYPFYPSSIVWTGTRLVGVGYGGISTSP